MQGKPVPSIESGSRYNEEYQPKRSYLCNLPRASAWLSLQGVDFQFRDYLLQKYPTIKDLNLRLGTAYRDYMEILPPQREMHYLSFLKQS